MNGAFNKQRTAMISCELKIGKKIR